MRKDNGKPKLCNFERVRNKLLSLDPTAEIIGIADPSSPYVIDQKEKYESYVDNGIIIQVGPREEADYYMIIYANNNRDCYIISNDGFKDYKIQDNLISRVVPVCIINGEVIFSRKLKN